MTSKPMVLGGGVTGLAVGMASGATVYEAAAGPGGICSSYYLRPQSSERLDRAPADGGAYRFEVGGGHWIFGGDPDVLDLLDGLSPLATHDRRAEVHFAATGATVPYPFQDHVAALDPALARRAFEEARADVESRSSAPVQRTLADWLEERFGPALCERFFDPFHERYTAGLFTEVEPQDAYKSPKGQAGYNAAFRYPPAGLDVLTRAMAERADVRFGLRAVSIDPHERTVTFADGSQRGFDSLVSTLPLHRTVERCDLAHRLGPPDPHTSVLVVNIGARRGPHCTDAHWVYDPESSAGFHRYGVYSNVDPSFVPGGDPDRVALYVEHAMRGGRRPTSDAERALVAATIGELAQRGVIGEVEAFDVSWVEVAYTWVRPGSTWVPDAIALLASMGVEQVGRYARWHFQGIAESVADGLAAGRALAERFA